jgi:two-component sensor histidine kinase
MSGQESELAAEVRRRTSELLDTVRELEREADAKTALLHEVDHRVKNNLQVISALVALQSRHEDDPRVRGALLETLERIEALATVHRRFYRSEDVARFDIAAFAHDLAFEIAGASGRVDLDIRFALEPIDVPTEKASPLALLVNELLSHAVKRSAASDSGFVAVHVRRSEGHLLLRIEGDGAGRACSDFSRKVIDTLAQQLQAVVEWDRGADAPNVKVRLPVEPTANRSRGGDLP